MDKFSADEINLMCIYDTSCKENLYSDLVLALKDIYNPEMIDVFKSVIKKLEKITEANFLDIGFYIVYEYFKEGELNIDK